MSEAVQVAIVATSGPTLIGALTLFFQYRQGRKIEVIHKATNSLTDRLVETTRTEAHAAGVKEEKENPS